MKDITEARYGRDDIDRIVDALLQNPDQAGDIKALLRQKMTAPDIVHVVRAARPERATEELDDFWDNVPV